MAQPNLLLKEGYIRATQLSALNDPFEALYCKKNLNELSASFEYCATGKELLDYIEKNKNKVGIISMTEEKDNLLMWAHYANEHKGAVFGIHTEMSGDISMFENLFNLMINSTTCPTYKTKIFRGKCLPVIYRKQPRYRVDKFDFDYSNIEVEGADRLLFEIFQQKSDEWIYEKEHRITLRLEQADKVLINDIEKMNKNVQKEIKSLDCCSKKKENGKDVYTIYLNKIVDTVDREYYAESLAELAKNPDNLYLFKLDSSAICTVLLGHRTNIEDINLDSTYPRKTGYFEIWETKVDESFYTLQFEEISSKL